MRIYLLLLWSISLPMWTMAQETENLLVNGDLETERTGYGTSFVPEGWEDVPYTAPMCRATFNAGATPDLTNIDGPMVKYGIYGTPFSGKTFISGFLISSIGFDGSLVIWHEGIQQQISGLEADSTYKVSFYQSVVKQANPAANTEMLDPSGSWAVYIDNVLVGITKPSYSNIAYNNPNLKWDFRTLDFTAISDTHLLAFLPYDDDDDIFSTATFTEGIRMGIDKIGLVKKKAVRKSKEGCYTIYPNPSVSNGFAMDLEQEYPILYMDVVDALGRTVYHTQYTDTQQIFEELALDVGVYYVTIYDDDGFRCTTALVRQ